MQISEQEIKRILTSNGTLCMIEFYKDVTQDGPLIEMRISPKKITQMLHKTSYSAEVIGLKKMK